MIRNNSSESLALLNSFFKNELSNIDIPELVRIDSLFGLWNSLIFTNSNLTSLKLENMEQAPYILDCENLLELKLDKLQEVEFSGGMDGLYLNNLSNYPTRFLHNSKIQSLSLPSFKGTQYPLPSNSNSINEYNARAASFWDNYCLRDVSLGNSKMRIEENGNYKFNGYWFNNNYFLKFLRLNYPYVIPLVRNAGLYNTPLGSGSGYIYVPDELVASYQSASNWNQFSAKIKSLDQYKDDLETYKDIITDDWPTILANCANNTISKYNIGDTKTVMINNVPTQFMIVNKRGQSDVADIDFIADDNNNETTEPAALTWVERTITRFSPPQSVQDVFSTENPRQFKNATNFRNIITQIYDNIEPTVKAGIKKVIKNSVGRDSGGQIINCKSADYLWPPSRLELGLSLNASPYKHYKTRPIINYYLGETNINEIRGTKICVALRDYSGQSSSYPDLLRPNSDPTKSMDVIDTDNTNPYIIVGFCT